MCVASSWDILNNRPCSEMETYINITSFIDSFMFKDKLVMETLNPFVKYYMKWSMRVFVMVIEIVIWQYWSVILA